MLSSIPNASQGILQTVVQLAHIFFRARVAPDSAGVQMVEQNQQEQKTVKFTAETRSPGRYLTNAELEGCWNGAGRGSRTPKSRSPADFESSS
jgi:hypothetical protein